MKSLGMTGAARPKERPGDLDRVKDWLQFLSVDKATREYVTEVHEATLAHDKARDEATAAIAEAKDRDAAARETEGRARTQREDLAKETAESQGQLRRGRAGHDREREQLDRLAKKLANRDSDITAREQALQRAFDAHKGE